MADIFSKIGHGLADAGNWIANSVRDAVTLASKVETVLIEAKPLEQPFIQGLSTVVADLEGFLATASGVVSADGLNLTADSKAFSQFRQLITDFKTFAPIVEQALAILKKESNNATTAH